MSLLDYLNTDDARLGLGLLAAGGPTTDPNRSGFGQRIAGALQGVQAQQDNDLRAQLLKSQITENASQDAMRRQQLAMAQRKQAMQEGLLGYGSNPGVPSASTTPGLIASAPSAGGGAAPGAGIGAPGTSASPNAPVQTPRGPMTLQQLSQTYQIPYESLAFDLVNNDGKGIPDMIFKRGAPDMKVDNGYAYDRNKLGAGYLPQLNISSNGQATQVQIGPDGQPVVSAPQGAVGTYGAYQGAANRSAADYQPEKVIDPGTGRMVVQPRSNVLQPTGRPLIGPGVTSPGLAGGSSSAAAVGQVQILAQELPKAQAELQAAQQRGDQAGVARAQQDIAGLTRELQRLPGGAQALGGAGQSSTFAPSPLIGPGAGRGAVQPALAGNVVELSPAELAANKAAEVRGVDTAKADVVRDTDVQKKMKSAGTMIAAADRAIELLKQDPTGSGMGATREKVFNYFGKTTTGAQVASRLDIVAGDLLNNVPRMEGPQSDGDRLQYKEQAGNASSRNLPVEQRIAAMQEIKKLQIKYAALNGGVGESAQPEKTPGKTLDTLPTPNSTNRGQRIRDTTTGKILRSDGIQWREE